MEARLLLEHPFASRLTARQRCALLWLSQGLILTDVARRMATTVQAVHRHVSAARWRLRRLDDKHIATLGSGNDGPASDADDLDGSVLAELLDIPSRVMAGRSSPTVPVPSPASTTDAAIVTVPAATDVPSDAGETSETAGEPAAGPKRESVTGNTADDDAAPSEQPHESVGTEPVAEQARDEYAERYGDLEGDAPCAQSNRPRLRLSDLQRTRRGW